MWRSSSLAGAAGCILACAMLTACRQDMQDQPKYKPLAESDFFQDHRSARPQVEGTIARGHLHLDQVRYTGKVNNNDVDYFPFPITKADILRGQQRFDIYCSPCHSRLGDGMGMIVRRGYRQPPSYYSPKLMTAPVGHFFDVMTNGFGGMPSYATRVSPDDRWRIIAYIKALQLSMSGKAGEVPADQRQELDQHPEPLPLGPYNMGPPNPAVMRGTVPTNQTPAPPNSGPNATPVQPAPGSPGEAPASKGPQQKQ